jgi:MerR family transcriptional regulator, light-induced transcriptional regulator
MGASAAQSQSEEPQAQSQESQLQDPPLTVGAAARRLGVAVETLRSWQSRYGLGPEDHTPGTRRRYGAADIRRLEEFCRLVGAGAAAPEAAKAVLAGYVSGGDAASGGSAHTPRVGGAHADSGDSPRADRIAAGGSAAAARAGSASASAFASGVGTRTGAGTARPGGGRTLPVGRGGGAAARGLARSAVRLDTPQVLDLLDTAISQEGVVGAWESTISPALLAVGRKWSETSGRYVEVEHLLSWCVTTAMHRRLNAAPGGGDAVAAGRGPVLLACAPEEWHCLPLEVLNAALAERGVPARMLGAAVPAEAVYAAARRIAPTHVVIWSQTPRTADRAVLPAPGPRDRWAALAAGPGWPAVRPPVTSVLTTLDGALRACRV